VTYRSLYIIANDRSLVNSCFHLYILNSKFKPELQAVIVETIYLLLNVFGPMLSTAGSENISEEYSVYNTGTLYIDKSLDF